MADILAAAAANARAMAASSAVTATAATRAPPQSQPPPPPSQPAAPSVTPVVITDAQRAELEAKAEEMALKSVASWSEKDKAAKLPAIKAGILKRLLTQAQSAPRAVQSVPPVNNAPPPPPVTSQTDNLDLTFADDEDIDRQRMGLQRPPTELPPPQDGVEACGDDPWYADPQVRLALRDAVEIAHSEFKILVRDAGEEIARICPKDGHELKAGAVLRLGGYHLGGYGEADVAYAFRQLSRALHPDKNPDNPDASSAFRRLKEAETELKRGLDEARSLLRRLAGPFMYSTLGKEELKRPQEAVFAEATRLVASVLVLFTEGEVPEAAKQRSLAFMRLSQSQGGGNWALPLAPRIDDFLAAWITQPDLLTALSDPAVRNAYDCAPKRYRAHFLCLLTRAAMLEGEKDGCVRQTWSVIWEVFPEIQLWQALRELIVKKCQVHGRQGKRDRSRSPRRESKVSESDFSQWAKRWRKIIRAVLPGGGTAAVPWSDQELRKLCAALWRDFVDPLEKGDGAEAETWKRCLNLFRTENRGAADVAAQKGAAPADWAFVPAADLLLIVGRGLVGVTVEGVFADGSSSKRMPFASAIFQTMM